LNLITLLSIKKIYNKYIMMKKETKILMMKRKLSNLIQDLTLNYQKKRK